MSAYRLTVNNIIIRTADNAAIPMDDRNTDYVAYLHWLALGNVPDSPPPDTSGKMSTIDQWREQAIAAATAAYNGHTWQCDRISTANLNAAITTFSAGVPVPAGFAWRTSDNINVPVVMADLVGIAAASLLAVNVIYQHSWTLKAAASAATTQAQLDAIVW